MRISRGALLSLYILLILLLVNRGFGQDDIRHATGCRPPTATERIWMQQHLVHTASVRLNALGLSRVNAHRLALGAAALPAEIAVPLGSESSSDTRVDVITASLPSSVDNSKLKAFPPIRNQGTLGSCVAFATSYYAMTYMTAFARGWDASGTDETKHFSPKWTYNLLNGGVDNGVWIADSYALMLQGGCATWAAFPYDSNYRQWCTDPTVWRNAINTRLSATGYVDAVDTDAGLQNVKALLANGYVLNFATNINSWQFTTIKGEPGSHDNDDYLGQHVCAWLNAGDSGHAMTVVGYNDTLWVDINGNGVVDTGERGAFLIANSWGTNWKDGNNGFIWLAYDALKAASAISGGPSTGRQAAWWDNTAYWITARASYTPTIVAQFTLNTTQRNMLEADLGISDTAHTSPTVAWSPSILFYNGTYDASYAFNGTTTACDGGFVFDLSDLAGNLTTRQRYYLQLTTVSGGTVTVKAYKIIDVAHGNIELAATNLPKVVNNATMSWYVEYAAPQAKPDLQVSAIPGAGYIGDNIYNQLNQQTMNRHVVISDTALYYLRVQNDGSMADSFTFTGLPSGGGWTVEYYDALTDGNDITQNIASGSWSTPLLNPGDTYDIRLEVTPTFTVTRGVPRAITVTAKSTMDATVTDTICATTVRDNALPVATDGTLIVQANGAASGRLTATDADNDAMTFNVVTPAQLGTVTITNTATGAYSYQPNTGATGTDTFTFKANDGLNDSNIATVTITITASIKGDVYMRPNGDGTVGISDWVQMGRFVAGLDTPTADEFQRADCAPQATQGDGKLTIADWVQSGRYALGLDPLLIMSKVATTHSAALFTQARSSAKCTVRIERATIPRGQLGTVTISLPAPGNANALGFTVHFNSACLTFIKANPVTSTGGIRLITNVWQAGKGQVGIAIALPPGTTVKPGAQPLLELTFRAANARGFGSTPVTFSDQVIARETADERADLVPTTYIGGMVTITRR